MALRDPRYRHRALPREPLRVEQHLWVLVAMDCFLAVFGTWLAAVLLGRRVPLWEVTGPAAVLTGVIWLACLLATGSRALAAWLLAWGVTLTCWLGWARLAGAWTSHVIEALITAFAVLTPLGPPAIASWRAAGDADADAAERERQRREVAKYERMFARLQVRGVKVTGIFRHGAGLEVHGTLSGATDEHGVATFDTLKGKAPEIATHLRIGGGAVSFEQPDPDNFAAFVMHLYTRKGKRPVEYLPASDRRASCDDPLELGRHDNGRPFRLRLIEVVLMIIGSIGSGKSNLLGAVIGQLCPCEDALIFVIDLKFRLSRPWLMPWVEELYDGRPVIDWLATTREEASRMLDALLAAGNARARQGAGGEKLRPSRKRPNVYLLVDESVVMTGHDRRDGGITARQLATKIARVVETYRSEGIVSVISGVRSDVETMGLTAIKAQALARICLRVNEPGDAERLLPGEPAAAKTLARIQDEGAGLATVKGRMLRTVHFYRVTPKIAYWTALRTAHLRPEPDDYLAAAMDEIRVEVDGKDRGAYESRWDRMGDLLDEWRASADEWRNDKDVGIGPALDPAVVRQAGPAATAVLDQGPPAPGGGPGDDDQDAWDRAFREIVAQVPDPDGEVNPARRRMRELLIAAAPGGYTVGALEKQLAHESRQQGRPELKVHRNTIHRWLREDEGPPHQLVRRKGGRLNDPRAAWTWIRQAGDDGPDLRPRGPDDEEDWPS